MAKVEKLEERLPVTTVSTSAASIAKIFSGIEFPKDKNELVDYANENKAKVESSDDGIDSNQETTRWKIS